MKMTWQRWTVVAILVMAVAAWSASAQDGQKRARAGQGGAGPQMSLERLDTNKDGKVSQEEFLAIAKKQFAAKDKDGDGMLTQEELSAPVARRGAAANADEKPAKGGKKGKANKSDDE